MDGREGKEDDSKGEQQRKGRQGDVKVSERRQRDDKRNRKVVKNKTTVTRDREMEAKQRQMRSWKRRRGKGDDC